MYTEEKIAQADSEVERLEEWLRHHKRPSGIFGTVVNGVDLHDVGENIRQDAYYYLRSKDRAAYRFDASLGHATWVATSAMIRFRGYKRLYLRQLSTLGGTLLHALQMRERNAFWREQVVREAREIAERKERQTTPSPWGTAVCAGCGALKRAWSDTMRNVCARCGTPLGELPAP